MHQHFRISVILLGLAACSGKSSPANPPVDSAATSMPSQQVELKGRAMLPAFRAHLDSVARHPNMMRNSMSQHRSEVKSLVAAMHSDMMALRMHSDPAYEALADSVVQGSARLATAGGAAFNRLVAQHIDQLRRLTSVYESKTASMR